jgi:hypothetical protein
MNASEVARDDLQDKFPDQVDVKHVDEISKDGKESS